MARKILITNTWQLISALPKIPRVYFLSPNQPFLFSPNRRETTTSICNHHRTQSENSNPRQKTKEKLKNRSAQICEISHRRPPWWQLRLPISTPVAPPWLGSSIIDHHSQIKPYPFSSPQIMAKPPPPLPDHHHHSQTITAAAKPPPKHKSGKKKKGIEKQICWLRYVKLVTVILYGGNYDCP